MEGGCKARWRCYCVIRGTDGLAASQGRRLFVVSKRDRIQAGYKYMDTFLMNRPLSSNMVASPGGHAGHVPKGWRLREGEGRPSKKRGRVRST